MALDFLSTGCKHDTKEEEEEEEHYKYVTLHFCHLYRSEDSIVI